MFLIFPFQVNGQGSSSSCKAVLPAPYRGIKDVCTRVFQEGGIRGLYRGVCKSLPLNYITIFLAFGEAWICLEVMKTLLAFLSDLLWPFCRSHSVWYPAICRTEVLCIWDTQGELVCWGRTTVERQASLWGCGWCCGPNCYLPFGCCAAANAGNVLPVSCITLKEFRLFDLSMFWLRQSVL